MSATVDTNGRITAPSFFTIDVEDWFHILGTPEAPKIDTWRQLDSRVERNLHRLLELLADAQVEATLFWLGWIADRFPKLVIRAQAEGHETASHGYEHLLAFEVGREAFLDDIITTSKLLEDITGNRVLGCRAPGFSVKSSTDWFYDVVRQAGYLYDSSVFPVLRGHGGMTGSPRDPYTVETRYGTLLEIPQSVVSIFGRDVCLFGGGYLRATPLRIIKWACRRMDKQNRPLCNYVHPRDIDPDQPRLPLPLVRRFKCYVNLRTTEAKLKWLLSARRYIRMDTFYKQFMTDQTEDSQIPDPQSSEVAKKRSSEPTITVEGGSSGLARKS